MALLTTYHQEGHQQYSPSTSNMAHVHNLVSDPSSVLANYPLLRGALSVMDYFPTDMSKIKSIAATYIDDEKFFDIVKSTQKIEMDELRRDTWTMFADTNNINATKESIRALIYGEAFMDWYRDSDYVDSNGRPKLKHLQKFHGPFSSNYNVNYKDKNLSLKFADFNLPEEFNGATGKEISRLLGGYDCSQAYSVICEATALARAKNLPGVAQLFSYSISDRHIASDFVEGKPIHRLDKHDLAGMSVQHLFDFVDNTVLMYDRGIKPYLGNASFYPLSIMYNPEVGFTATEVQRTNQRINFGNVYYGLSRYLTGSPRDLINQYEVPVSSSRYTAAFSNLLKLKEYILDTHGYEFNNYLDPLGF